jgi:hypothetical protein
MAAAGPSILASGGDSIVPVLLIPLVIMVVIATWIAHFSRSKTLLEKWAAENGFEILQREQRYISQGPFFWTTSRSQVVYHVNVRDGLGNVRSGWVRCGGWFLGMWSDKTEVKWEDSKL